MKSIRRKITISYFALAAGTLVITGVLLLVTTRIMARQVETEALRETAGTLLPEIQALLQDENDPAQIDRFIRLVESLGDVEIRFVGPEGEVEPALLFTNRFRSDFMPGPHPGRARPMPPHNELNRMLDRFMDDDPRRILTERTQPGPSGVLRFGAGDESAYFEITDRTDLSERITRLAGVGFLIAALVTLGAAGLIGVLVGSGISRPIISLTGTVGTMRSGNLSARAETTSNDEIGTLAVQFNSMADQLSETILVLRAERDSLKEFLADASHELRTPITAMKTFVELLQKETPEHQDLLLDLEHQVSRMGETVGSLLALSRLDGGVTSLEITTFPAVEMLKEAREHIVSSGSAESVHIEIDSGADAPIELHGDRSRLVTVFENLFQNSLNAIEAEGAITCRVRSSGSGVQISVVDDGTGISPADLPRVFDRFYRGTRKAPEGSGLGLAIAKAIVTLHGGEITAISPASGRQRGTEIVVMLPLKPAA